MPQRASRRDIGAAVGRMVFQGRDEHAIMRRLKAVGSSKLRDALAKRGLYDVTTKELTDVLTGKHQSGWSQAKLRNTVEAFQDLKVARAARSASAMVLTASREAQETAAQTSAGNELLKAKMRHMVVKERQKAEEEAVDEPSLGVLDRMRGAMGRANRADAAPASNGQGANGGSGAGSIREVRERWREELGLKKDRIQPPRPKNGQNRQNKPGFQP